MANKISINLLPAEVLVLDKDKNKQKNLMRLAVGILIVMLFITIVIFSERIFQNQKLEQTNSDLVSAQNQVASLKDQESALVYLKQRLSSIYPIISQDSKQAQSYSLISALTPDTVKIVSLTIDKTGTITMSALASDSDSIKTFLDNLVNPATNQGKIASAHLDNLSRSANNLYRVDLTIKTP